MKKYIIFRVRVEKSFIEIIDEWRRKQKDIPNRSEAVRRLVVKGAKK